MLLPPGCTVSNVRPGLAQAGSSSREIGRQQAAQGDFTAYIRQAGGPAVSAADELTKLAARRDSGVITEDEFAAQKVKILA